MEAEPPPQPSSSASHKLTGGYLLVILSEPFSQEHKERIIQKVSKGLLSWNVESTGCDLQGIENVCKYAEVEDGTDMLIQHATDTLAVEVLLNPEVNTVKQCIKNLLASTTRHKHLIHAGYSFAGSGSWILQDGDFAFRDFADAFQDAEAQRILRAFPECTVHVHCTPEGDWSRANLEKQTFSRQAHLSVNPPDKITSLPGSSALIECLETALVCQSLEEIMKSSSVVGNIRFHRPTLYVFPGGQGDCALFGVSGFNMLVDGGFNRKPCFWEFIRHLDRLDAVLVTRLSESNLCGVSSMFKRKVNEPTYPQIGYVFCNIAEVKYSPSDETQKDRDELLVSVINQGHEFLENLYHLELKPHLCYRASSMEPFTLFHKVGHGTLEMYVISPPKESRELKDFLYQWASYRESFTFVKTGMRFEDKELTIPLSHSMSICALLIWKPADPKDTVTRIFFPGSAPQSKILEGLDKLKHLTALRKPVVLSGAVRASTSEKTKILPEKPVTRMPISKPRAQSPAQLARRSKEHSPSRKETTPLVEKKAEPIKHIKKTETPKKAEKVEKVEKVEKEEKKEPVIKKTPIRKETKAKPTAEPTKKPEAATKGTKDVANKKVVEAKVVSRRLETAKAKATTATPPSSPAKPLRSRPPPATGSPKQEQPSKPAKKEKVVPAPKPEKPVKKAPAKEDSNKKVVEAKVKSIRPIKKKVDDSLASKKGVVKAAAAAALTATAAISAAAIEQIEKELEKDEIMQVVVTEKAADAVEEETIVAEKATGVVSAAPAAAEEEVGEEDQAEDKEIDVSEEVEVESPGKEEAEEAEEDKETDTREDEAESIIGDDVGEAESPKEEAADDSKEKAEEEDDMIEKDEANLVESAVTEELIGKSEAVVVEAVKEVETNTVTAEAEGETGADETEVETEEAHAEDEITTEAEEIAVEVEEEEIEAETVEEVTAEMKKKADSKAESDEEEEAEAEEEVEAEVEVESKKDEAQADETTEPEQDEIDIQDEVAEVAEEVETEVSKPQGEVTKDDNEKQDLMDSLDKECERLESKTSHDGESKVDEDIIEKEIIPVSLVDIEVSKGEELEATEDIQPEVEEMLEVASEVATELEEIAAALREQKVISEEVIKDLKSVVEPEAVPSDSTESKGAVEVEEDVTEEVEAELEEELEKGAEEESEKGVEKEREEESEEFVDKTADAEAEVEDEAKEGDADQGINLEDEIRAEAISAGLESSAFVKSGAEDEAGEEIEEIEFEDDIIEAEIAAVVEAAAKEEGTEFDDGITEKRKTDLPDLDGADTTSEIKEVETEAITPSPSHKMVSSSPAPSDKAEISPVPSEKSAISPVSSEKVAASPAALETESVSPSQYEKDVESPIPSEKDVASPIPPEKDDVSPAPSEKDAVSPAATDKQAISPTPSDKGDVSFAQSEKGGVSPAPSDEVICRTQSEQLESSVPSDKISASPVPSLQDHASPVPSPVPSDKGIASPAPTPTPSDKGVASPAPTPTPSDKEAISIAPSPTPSDKGVASPAPTPTPSDKEAISIAPSPIPSDKGVASPAPTPTPSDKEAISIAPSPTPSDTGAVSSALSDKGAISPAPSDKGVVSPPLSSAPSDKGAISPTQSDKGVVSPAPSDKGAESPTQSPVPSDKGAASPAPSPTPSDKRAVSPAPSPTPSDKRAVSSAPSPSDKDAISSAPSPSPSDKDAISSAPSPAPSDKGAISSAPSPAPSDKGAAFPASSPAPSDKGAVSPAPSDKGVISSAPSPTPSDKVAVSPAPSPVPSDKGAVSPAPSPAPSDKGVVSPALSPAPSDKGAKSPAPLHKEAVSSAPSPAPSDKGAVSPAPLDKEAVSSAPSPAPSSDKGAVSPAPSDKEMVSPAPSPAPSDIGGKSPALSDKGAPSPAPSEKGAVSPAPSPAPSEKEVKSSAASIVDDDDMADEVKSTVSIEVQEAEDDADEKDVDTAEDKDIMDSASVASADDIKERDASIKSEGDQKSPSVPTSPEPKSESTDNIVPTRIKNAVSPLSEELKIAGFHKEPSEADEDEDDALEDELEKESSEVVEHLIEKEDGTLNLEATPSEEKEPDEEEGSLKEAAEQKKSDDEKDQDSSEVELGADTEVSAEVSPVSDKDGADIATEQENVDGKTHNEDEELKVSSPNVSDQSIKDDVADKDQEYSKLQTDMEEHEKDGKDEDVEKCKYLSETEKPERKIPDTLDITIPGSTISSLPEDDNKSTHSGSYKVGEKDVDDDLVDEGITVDESLEKLESTSVQLQPDPAEEGKAEIADGQALPSMRAAPGKNHPLDHKEIDFEDLEDQIEADISIHSGSPKSDSRSETAKTPDFTKTPSPSPVDMYRGESGGKDSPIFHEDVSIKESKELVETAPSAKSLKAEADEGSEKAIAKSPTPEISTRSPSPKHELVTRSPSPKAPSVPGDLPEQHIKSHDTTRSPSPATESIHEDVTHDSRKLSDAKSHESMTRSPSPKAESVKNEEMVYSRKTSDAKSHDVTRSPSPKTESIHEVVSVSSRKASDSKSQIGTRSSSPKADSVHDEILVSSRRESDAHSHVPTRSPSPKAESVQEEIIVSSRKASDAHSHVSTRSPSPKAESVHDEILVSSRKASDAHSHIPTRSPSPKPESVHEDLLVTSRKASDATSHGAVTRSPSPKAIILDEEIVSSAAKTPKSATRSPSPKSESVHDEVTVSSRKSSDAKSHIGTRSPSPRAESIREEPFVSSRKASDAKSHESSTRSPSPKVESIHCEEPIRSRKGSETHVQAPSSRAESICEEPLVSSRKASDAKSHENITRSPSPKAESVHCEEPIGSRKGSDAHVRAPSSRAESTCEEPLVSSRKASDAKSHESITRSPSPKAEQTGPESGITLNHEESHEFNAMSPSPRPDSIQDDISEHSIKFGETGSREDITRTPSPKPECFHEVEDESHSVEVLISTLETSEVKSVEGSPRSHSPIVSATKTSEGGTRSPSPKIEKDEASEASTKLSDSKGFDVTSSPSPKPESIKDDESDAGRKSCTMENGTRSQSPREIYDTILKASESRNLETSVNNKSVEVSRSPSPREKSIKEDKSLCSSIASEGDQNIKTGTPSPKPESQTEDLRKSNEKLSETKSHYELSRSSSPKEAAVTSRKPSNASDVPAITRSPSPHESCKERSDGSKHLSEANDFDPVSRSPSISIRDISEGSKIIGDAKDLESVTRSPSGDILGVSESSPRMSKAENVEESTHKSASPRPESTHQEDEEQKSKSSEISVGKDQRSTTRSPSPLISSTHEDKPSSRASSDGGKIDVKLPLRSPSPSIEVHDEFDERVHEARIIQQVTSSPASQESLHTVSEEKEHKQSSTPLSEKDISSPPKSPDALPDCNISRDTPDSMSHMGDLEFTHKRKASDAVSVDSIESVNVKIESASENLISDSVGAHPEYEHSTQPSTISSSLVESTGEKALFDMCHQSSKESYLNGFSSKMSEHDNTTESPGKEIMELSQSPLCTGDTSSAKDEHEQIASVCSNKGFKEDIRPSIDTCSSTTQRPLAIPQEVQQYTSDSDIAVESQDDEDGMIRHPTPPGEKTFYDHVGPPSHDYTDSIEEPLIEENEEDAVEEQPIYGNTLQADFAELVTLSEANTPSEPQSPLDAKVKTHEISNLAKYQPAVVKSSPSASDVQSMPAASSNTGQGVSDRSSSSYAPIPYEFDHKDNFMYSAALPQEGSNGHSYRTNDIMTASFHETYADDSDNEKFCLKSAEVSTEGELVQTTPSAFRGVWDSDVHHVESPVVSNGSPARKTSLEGSSQLKGSDHHSTKADLFTTQEPHGDCMTSSFYDFGDDNENVPVETTRNGKSHYADNVDTTLKSTKKDEMTTSFTASESAAKGVSETSSGATKSKEFRLEDWGKPLGLPSPPDPGEAMHSSSTNKSASNTPKSSKTKVVNSNKEEKTSRTSTENGSKPNSGSSPSKSAYGKSSGGKSSRESGTPVYVDLTYVPHHANPYYCNVEFFQRVRARYYVFSGTNPSKEVFNALIEAKRSWEDKNMEVTIIPTYETDTLGYWMASNQDVLAELKIDVAPSANRCTISLQDHETSCAAYRLEF